jgi:hypothetical protein
MPLGSRSSCIPCLKCTGSGNAEFNPLIHRASIHTKLLEYQNQGLEASLTIKKRRKKSSKALLLQEACRKLGGACFFLPSSLKSAQALQAEYQHQEDLAVATMPPKRSRVNSLQSAPVSKRNKVAPRHRGTGTASQPVLVDTQPSLPSLLLPPPLSPRQAIVAASQALNFEATL